MRSFYRLLAFLLLAAQPAFAGSIAVTPGSGTTVGAGSDGTNQIPATVLCGATASATLYATCVNQAVVNASGQLLVLAPLPTGAATSALQTTGNTSLATLAGGVSGGQYQVNCVTGCSGGGGGTVNPFASNGNYLNVPSVTATSANSTLPSGGGANIVLYNYGGYKIIFKLSSSGATTVTAATSDGIIQPGATQEIAVGSNTNIAYATTATGLTSSLQVVGGSGLWTGSNTNFVSNGQTNMAAPSFATEIGGLDNSGLLQSAQVTAVGTAATSFGLAIQGMSGGVAVPVSGTFFQTTQPVSAASLPLPTGAATSNNQTNGGQKSQIVDGSGNVIGSTSNSLNINCTGGCSGASGTTFAQGGATAPTNAGLAGATYNSSSPSLSSGQSVALQATAAGSLHTTVDNVNANGQATMANSSPVVIASDQSAISVSQAPSSSSSIGITPVVSSSAEASHVLDASPGNAYSAYATNLTATQGFLVLLNATSAPADGAITPLACAPLAPNGVASINYAPGPPGVFSTGIVAVVTSAATCFTKTTGVITAFISGSVK